MKTASIGAGTMEQILNQGLRVLIGVPDIGEGEMIRMEETASDEKTGRAFFARVVYDLGSGVLQIDLAPFMEELNPDTQKYDRLPMAGEYLSEKHTIPAAHAGGESDGFAFKAAGDRPVWLYVGPKWIEEIGLSGLAFDGAGVVQLREGRLTPPSTLKLNIQGQGGEKAFTYGLMAEG